MTLASWWPEDAPADPTARLALLGWDAEWETAFVPHRTAQRLPGRVGRVDRGLCTAYAADGVHRTKLATRDLEPAVGDWIAFTPEHTQSGALAHDILPRRTQFVRHAAGEQTVEQVVAANVDTVFIVNALDQRLSLRRIERYLTLTWQGGAQPVVVLTKADLAEDATAAVSEVESIAFGTPVHAVSVVTGDGVGDLDRHHSDGGSVALIGLSGAGKSTLINYLLGEERMHTREIRSDGKGRHTTSHRELVPLPGGGVLIDTPGMRTMGLWEGEDGLEVTFSDIEELAGGCRFSDCTHQHEPGCAVRAAIEDGRLEAERLASYEKLHRELAHLERKGDARAQAEQRRRWRSVNKALRNVYRERGR